MTHPLDTHSANIDALLTLVKDLVSITDKLIEGTGNDQFDTVTELTEVREGTVEHLDKVHRTIAESGGVPEPIVKELQTMLSLLNERSAVLNRTILEKSESLVSTIHAVQQNRFYGSK